MTGTYIHSVELFTDMELILLTYFADFPKDCAVLSFLLGLDGMAFGMFLP